MVLANGSEDTRQTLTTAQLLANTVDVDKNDAGLLTIENLHADHGSILNNGDGTFTFTPEKDYNGDVHFSYDVKDAHGGMTHTGASTTLTAVDDASVISGDKSSNIIEGDIGDSVTATGTLSISDVDKADNPDFPDVSSIATTYGHITMKSGQWTYTLDQNKVQQLDPDESAVIDHHTFTASDGSKQTVDITIKGTNDKPVIESAHAAPAGASSTLKLQDVAIIDNPTGANIDVAATNAENAQRWGADQVGVGSGVKLVGLYKPGSDHNWITHPATTSTSHSGAGGFNRVDSHDWWQNNGIPDTVNTGSGGASGHGNAWTGGIAVFEDSAGHQTIGIINRVCSGSGSGSEVDYLYYHSYQQLQVGGAKFSGTAAAGETINVMDGTTQLASVVADSNGHWEVAANHLSDGQHTLHIENGAGQHSAETVFEVTGHSVQNITPAGLNTELKEDSAQTTIDGELRTTDVDHGDTATITAQVNHTTQYGHFSIDANGQYHYTLDNSNQDVNHLGVHQTLTEIIPVTSTSTDGTSVTTNVTITIQGSVDQPILKATAPDAQQGSSMALSLDVAATDTGGDHEDLLIKISGLPDAATLNHGTHDAIAKMWVLHQSDLKGLELDLHDANFHGDLHFNVTATASAGGESESITKAVTLFVNAPPEIANTVTGNKAEDSGMGAIDLLAGASDADTGDSLSIGHLEYQLGSNTKTSAIPSYLTMGKDGHTLVVNANAPAFQHLGAGDTQTITVSYNISDTHGGTVQQTATVTVTGTNDAAVITGQATGSVSEDNPAQATGTLSVADTDDNQSQFTATTITGTYGSLTIDAQGAWHYSLSTSGTSGDNVQALADGQKVTDTLQIQSVDGTVHRINIGVTGANDQPTVTVQTLNASEDTDFTFTAANFGFTDTDSGDSLDHITITSLPDATQGELLLNGVAVSANQEIDNADIANLTFKPVANYNGDVDLSYTVNDGHIDSAPATTTLSVANVNDLPTVVATTQSTLEDTDIIITKAQLLTDSADIDSGDVLGINSVTVNGGHGSVTDNGNGTWTLHPDTNFKGDITLDYKINDGHADVDNHMTVQVSTVTDKADINLTSSVQQEIITTGTTGRIQIDDIQASAPLTEFTLEMTVIGKAVADTGASTGPVVVNMGHGSSTNMLSLWNPGNMKIGGAGDIATGINLGDGNSHRVTLTWDSASGDLNIYDNGVLAATAANYHKGGTLPADMYMVLGSKANGGIASPTWNAGEHYDGSIFNTAIASHALTPAQIALGPLASQLNVHTGLLADVRSVGGSIQDTTGSHSLAENGVGHELHTVDTTIGVPPAGSLVNLHPQVTSPDRADTVTGITLHGLVKGTVLADGTHSHTITGINDTVDIKDWDLNHMTAQLPPAVTRNMNIGITATSVGPDGQTAVVTEYNGLKLDPTRPIPNAIISGDNTNTVTEDVHESAGYITSDEHILSIQDADSGDDRFLASGEKEGSVATSGAWVAGDKGLGEFKLDSNGHWQYRVDNAGSNIQELKNGETLTETLTIYSHDGTPHELTATINGTDDIPVITPQSLTTQEDIAHTFSSAEFGFSDVDKGDTLASITVTDLPDSTQGTLLLDGHAVTQNQQVSAAELTKLVFTPAQDFNGNATFTYTVSDGTNDSATGSATIAVSAVNDAPIMVTTATQSVDEGDAQISGTVSATDVDGGDTLSFTTSANVDGFVLNTNGSYTFDPSHASYNGLAQGDAQTLTIPISVSDGHGGTATQNLSINLTGTNDAPSVTAVHLTGSEDSDYSFTAANFGFADVDNLDSLDHITITSLPDVTEGLLLLNGVAVIANQQIDNADIVSLTFTPVANFNGDVQFGYSVNDGHADSATAQVNLHFDNVVDAPTLSVSDATGVEDNAIALTLMGTAQTDDHIAEYVISGVPTGAQLSAGHNDGSGQWTVSATQVAGLTITPASNFSGDMQLQVIATASDGSHMADSSAQALTVHVSPDADVPVIDAFDVNGSSSIATAAGPASLMQVVTVTKEMHELLSTTFSSSVNTEEDARGFLQLEHATFSDIKSMKIDGQPVPEYVFSAFVSTPHEINTSKPGPSSVYIDFPLFALAEGKQIEIEFNPGTDPDVTIIIGSLPDSLGGFRDMWNNDFSAPEQSTIALSGLASVGVTPQTVSLHEDGGLDLNFSISSPDSSEALQLSIAGLPTGASLNHGVLQTNGTWLVDSGDVATLRATFPQNFNGGVDLSVKAISHDGASSLESAAMTRHIDIASVTDQASLTTGDISVDEHQMTWQDLPINTQEGDSQDPITAVSISNLSTQFELRLAPGSTGNAPVHNTDGTWTIDPQTVNHLQVHTDDHDGVTSVYQVSVITTGPDGITAENIHSGHVTYNAVIDSSISLEGGLAGTVSSDAFGQVTTVDLSANGTLQHIGGLLNFQQLDIDEHAMLYIRVPDNVDIYRPNGLSTYPTSNDMQTDLKGISTDSDPGYHTYQVPASELEHANIMGASTAVNGVDIKVRVEINEGTGVTGAHTTETFHFTGVDVAAHNFIPTVNTATISAQEDSDHTFTVSDFGFTDADGDTLNHVTITGLPIRAEGTLTFKGQAVFAGQDIAATDLDQLVFTPTANEYGDVHFKYTVNDGKDDSTEATGTISITNTADAPEIIDPYKPVDLGSTNEDTDHTFTSADLLANIHDADGDGSLSIKSVTVDPQYGTVSDDGHGNFTFHPKADYYGSDVPLHFVATDGTHDVNSHASVDVISVKDGPRWNAANWGFTKIQDGIHSLHGLLAPGRIAEGEHASLVEFRVYDANGDHDAGFKGCKISDGNGHEYTFTGATNEKADITGWDYDHIKIEPNTGGAYSFNGTAWLYTENDPHPIQFNSGVHHDSGSITEDQNSMVQGYIDAHPGDGNDIDFTPAHMAGTYGTLDLQADGTWKYTLDSVKSDGLNDGDLKQETFTVSTTAGDHHDINIDVHGNTDGPSSLLPPPPPTMADTPENADVLNVDVVEEPIQDMQVSLDDLQVTSPSTTLVTEEPASSGASAYLQALGISIDNTLLDTQQQVLPDDIDIILGQADLLAVDHDATVSLDLSDALAHGEHDVLNEDDHDDTQHHHQVNDLPDFDPNS
ncbi:hypothetical protein A1QI_12995 [Vibrio genomosp. F10 str. 9ZB36]|nr:hypothetical protein A1QI_12995 [Vibrio genomosp. F10 str. 9ZB36]